jgi:hypothetical protein
MMMIFIIEFIFGLVHFCSQGFDESFADFKFCRTTNVKLNDYWLQ